MIGKTVSHYRILEEIPGGGMGDVYKAQDINLDRLVVVKFPKDETCLDPSALERFKREAKAASSLSHRNICAIYDFGDFEGKPFLVMELLKGQTLQKEIGGQGLTTQRAVAFGIEIANALAAAHKNGILHRDIKPGNIFVTDEEVLKILDFGLAKVLSQSVPDSETAASLETVGPETDSGSRVGTANYMSPETMGRTDTRCSDRSLLYRCGALRDVYGAHCVFRCEHLRRNSPF